MTFHFGCCYGEHVSCSVSRWRPCWLSTSGSPLTDDTLASPTQPMTLVLTTPRKWPGDSPSYRNRRWGALVHGSFLVVARRDVISWGVAFILPYSSCIYDAVLRCPSTTTCPCFSSVLIILTGLLGERDLELTDISIVSGVDVSVIFLPVGRRMSMFPCDIFACCHAL